MLHRAVEGLSPLSSVFEGRAERSRATCRRRYVACPLPLRYPRENSASPAPKVDNLSLLNGTRSLSKIIEAQFGHLATQ